MAELLPESASHDRSSSEDQAVLVQTLDHRLERYLQLLHQHQTLQRDLAKQLSSGYLSLARANYASPTGGRPYGQDFYDERMKASSFVSVDSSISAFWVFKATHSTRSPLPEEDKSDRIGSPSLHVADDVVEAEITSSEAIAHGKAVVPPSDPLKWFGILIPPALRSAQTSFKGAIEDVVPSLASVVHEMRVVEDQVRETREQIQIVPQ